MKQILSSPFYGRGNQGMQEVLNSNKVTREAEGRIRIQTQSSSPMLILTTTTLYCLPKMRTKLKELQREIKTQEFFKQYPLLDHSCPKTRGLSGFTR